MNLLVQGPDIPTRHLKELAQLTAATAIEAVSRTGFRLVGADERVQPDVAAFCDTHALDWGWVPAERHICDFGLLVMDMDSTLITMETVDELADMVGLKAQVAAITAQAMRGEIEYDESLRQRVALLKDLDASALQRVYDERLELTMGADVLLRKTQALGMKTLLVSGGFTYVTDRLKARLNLDRCHSNVLEIAGGRLTGNVLGAIVNADGKRRALIELRDELGITSEQVIGIGDGANDLKFLAECGVSVAFHAKPVVRDKTTHAVNYVGLDGVLHLFN